MTLSSLTRRPIAACTAEQAADALTRCFENYIVPMRMTAEQFERRFRSEHLDPFASSIWFDGQVPAIIAVICRRGWTSRLAAFGVTVALRGKGLAKKAMLNVLAEARARGDQRMLLEVIEGNAAAIRLYESLGFSMKRRLVGYDWTNTTPKTATGLHEVDVAEAANLMTDFADSDLPWQLEPAGFYALTPPTRAFALNATAIAFVDAAGGTARLRGLAVDPSHRRHGLGRKLLEALPSAVSAQNWSIPAIVPEGLAAPALTRLGWTISSLSQREMVVQFKD